MRRTLDFSSNDYDTLLQLVYSGHSEEKPWRTFLTTLQRMLQSNTTVLTLGNPTRENLNLISEGVSGKPSSNALNKYISLSPFTPLPDGEVKILSSLIDKRYLRSSEFYQTCLAPNNIEHIIGHNLFDGGQQIAYLRSTRSSRDSDYSRDDIALCQFIAPHLGTSVKAARKLEDQLIKMRLLEDIVSKLNIGVILINADRRVLETNRLAEEIVANSQQLSIKGGKLTTPSSNKQAFKNSIFNILGRHDGGQLSNIETITLKSKDGQEHLQLLFKPLIRKVNGRETAQIAVMIASQVTPIHVNSDILSNLFAYTPSESAIAISIAQGFSVKETAEKHAITLNTTRTHIKSILRKSNVSQQTSFVASILRSVARLG